MIFKVPSNPNHSMILNHVPLPSVLRYFGGMFFMKQEAPDMLCPPFSGRPESTSLSPSWVQTNFVIQTFETSWLQHCFFTGAWILVATVDLFSLTYVSLVASFLLLSRFHLPCSLWAAHIAEILLLFCFSHPFTHKHLILIVPYACHLSSWLEIQVLASFLDVL